MKNILIKIKNFGGREWQKLILGGVAFVLISGFLFAWLPTALYLLWGCFISLGHIWGIWTMHTVELFFEYLYGNNLEWYVNYLRWIGFLETIFAIFGFIACLEKFKR